MRSFTQPRLACPQMSRRRQLASQWQRRTTAYRTVSVCHRWRTQSLIQSQAVLKIQVCCVRKTRYGVSENPGMLCQKTQVCHVRKPRCVTENPGMTWKTQACHGKPRYDMENPGMSWKTQVFCIGKPRYAGSGLYTWNVTIFPTYLY